MFGENTYKEDVKSFKQIPSTEADKLLSSEKLTVVYIGRETCPYCRKFAKKLGNLYNKLNTTIHYDLLSAKMENGKLVVILQYQKMKY